MEDGTEFFGVLISYADRIKWAKFAAERKESGAGDWRVDTAGTIWCALQRQGMLSTSVNWPTFWPQLADWDRVADEEVNPTDQATGPI